MLKALFTLSSSHLFLLPPPCLKMLDYSQHINFLQENNFYMIVDKVWIGYSSEKKTVFQLGIKIASCLRSPTLFKSEYKGGTDSSLKVGRSAPRSSPTSLLKKTQPILPHSCFSTIVLLGEMSPFGPVQLK